MKTMLLTAVFFAALSSTAQASSEQLGVLLSGYDNAVSPSDLARLSADPVADLIAVANNTLDHRMLARGRAVQLLGQYNEARAHEALLVFAVHAIALFSVRSCKALGFLAGGTMRISRREAMCKGRCSADRLTDK